MRDKKADPKTLKSIDLRRGKNRKKLYNLRYIDCITTPTKFHNVAFDFLDVMTQGIKAKHGN